MSLKNFKIEHLFLISLFSWFLVGYSNFLNIILSIQLISIFFFLDLKLKNFKLIISIIVIAFVYYFSQNFDALKFYMMLILIILSFDFEKKVDRKINLKEILILLLLFISIILYKYHPQVQNYSTIFKLKKDIISFDKSGSEKVIFKKNFIINTKNPYCPKICENLERNCDTKICSQKINHSDTRFTINNVDVNFVSIILLSLLFLFLYVENDRKKIYLFLFVVIGFWIIFLTKSRAGLIFYLISISMFIFPNIGSKKIFLLFIISHVLIIGIGYLMVNSVLDPMKMYHPEISEKGLINLPVSQSSRGIDENFITLKRLFIFFDSSNYIRFSSFFQAYLIYLNDFIKILISDHTSLVSEISYKTYVGENFIVKNNDYDPHNYFMAMTKEIGLIGSLYFHYLIFSFLKFRQFKIYLVPLLFSSIFLGLAVTYLIPTILVFCFKTNNNFYKYKKKLLNAYK